MGNAPGSSGTTGRRRRGSRGRPSYQVRVAATEILHVAGLTAYHTSVIIGDCEYFFDSLGVMAAPPLWSHLVRQNTKRPKHIRTEVTDIGKTTKRGKDMAEALRPFFDKGTYDLFYKNCNHFTDCALWFLMNSRLGSQYTRPERLMVSTDPLSTHLMNRIFKAFVEKNTGEECNVDLYVTNPQAEDFNIDEVMASIDDLTDSDQSDGYDSDDLPVVGCGFVPPAVLAAA